LAGVLDRDDKTTTAEFFLRAQAVREIAQGLFDKTERDIVLKFAGECEALNLSKDGDTGA
jgi:hypothetical protein